MTTNSQTHIPDQKEGGYSDVVETVEAADIPAAKKLFREARQRMLDVNNWNEISSGISAQFQLTDLLGVEKDGIPDVGDHFQIAIPGPGLKSGEGFDWVEVELLDDKTLLAENEECFTMRVRPANDPRTDNDEVAHFFDRTATSSFMVRREGNTVFAEVHGRNEKLNTDTEAVSDKVRNTLVGIGAIAGVAEMQWKKLAKGVLSAE